MNYVSWLLKDGRLLKDTKNACVSIRKKNETDMSIKPKTFLIISFGISQSKNEAYKADKVAK